MPTPTPGTKSYTAPVRRGFGHLAHLLAAATKNPTGPVASYLSSCSPQQRKDIQDSIDYMDSEYRKELAKFGFTSVSLAPVTPSEPAPSIEDATNPVCHPDT